MTQSDLIGRAKILDTERNLCGVLARPFPSPKGLKVKGRFTTHETKDRFSLDPTPLERLGMRLSYNL